MTSDTQAGFTIIESMLFLAISALVFIVGFAGIGSRLEAVRYSDSVRNLESDVETVFRNADDGLNLRLDSGANSSCSASGQTPLFGSGGTKPGTNAECAVAGVDVAFDESVGGRDSLIAQAVAIVTGENSGGVFEYFSAKDINEGTVDVEDLIESAVAVPGTADTYDLLWGLQYIGYLNSGAVISSDATIRYIRSPISTQTFVYADTGSSFSQLTNSLYLCFRDNSDRSATLTVQPGATIDVAYQGGACDI